jgi:hypothetical protein
MNEHRHDRVAHVVVADRDCRVRIKDTLARRGWHVVEHATGFHLLQAIGDIIDGRLETLPRLLVVDAFARGCSGISIAAGLRELGVRIPLVLVAQPGQPIPRSDDLGVRIAGPSHVAADVAEVAQCLDYESTVAGEPLPSDAALSQ